MVKSSEVLLLPRSDQMLRVRVKTNEGESEALFLQQSSLCPNSHFTFIIIITKPQKRIFHTHMFIFLMEYLIYAKYRNRENNTTSRPKYRA